MSSMKKATLLNAIGTLFFLATIWSGSVAIADEGIVPYNTGNTNYHFNLGGNYSSTAATTGRLKEDTTSIFIWPHAIDFDMCYIYGEGSHSPSGSWASGSSQTVNGFGIVRKSDEERPLSLMTYIKENGYSYARITAWQCSQAGWMSGDWSPDSTQPYTYCNNGYH